MRFRHYKGGFYEFVALAKEEADPQNLLVVYKAETDGSVWARPSNVFFERVQHLGENVSRFTVQEPSEEQRFCCDNGCDVVLPRPAVFEYSREEDSLGNVVAVRSQPYWACQCGEDARIFDNITGDVTDLPENE